MESYSYGQIRSSTVDQIREIDKHAIHISVFDGKIKSDFRKTIKTQDIRLFFALMMGKFHA